MTSKSSKFYLFGIILILILTTISAFTCKFTDHKFDDDQLLYTCEITSQTTNNPETHLTAKTDADVKAFTIDGISHLNSSELPFCERFSNLERVKIFGANFIDQNLLKKCSNLTFVSIKNGKIKKLSENLFSENFQLNFVELSNLNLKELPEKIFNNLKNLKGLTITSNELIHLPPKIFNSQQKLGILFLGSNGFKSLNPIWFEKLQNLAFLELSFNKIENLPKNVFKSLINLQHLWLWANELTVIHADSFGTHLRLKNVDLRQNKINEIDGKLLESLAVESLDMEIQNVCFRGKITNKSDIRKKLKKCLENYKPRKESKLKCGTHKIGKETILGGTEIEQGSYPWNAALETTEGKYICGGTLVSDKTIVTAAHCLMNNPEESIYEPSNIKVLLGGHNLNIPESNRISASVKSINIHSEWNSHDADIAVLELNDEIQFNDFIQPICLIEEDAEKFENLPAKIVGFENSENIAKVFVVKNQICNKIEEFEGLLSPRTFCSGYEDGIGSCRGDIGTGLIIQKDGNFYLRGIVSASLRNIKNDCEEAEHLVLTDVVKFTSFIKSDGRDVFDDKLRLLREENEKLKERVKELQEALNKKNGSWLCKFA